MRGEKLKSIILLVCAILGFPIFVYFTDSYREIKEDLYNFYITEFNEDIIIDVHKENPKTRDEYKRFAVSSNPNSFRILLSANNLRDSLFAIHNIVSKRKFSDEIILKANNENYTLKFKNSSEITFPWDMVEIFEIFLFILLIMELIIREPIIRMP